MSSLTYLITGANRGIGQGFVSTLLLRPNTTVIAAVRDVSKASSLESIPKGSGSKLILIKIDASSETDPFTAVTELKTKHNITSLDIVIANAGIGHSGGPISSTTPSALHDHINVNTLGPILLFQATSPLLRASTSKNPIFLGISTAIASLGIQDALSFLPQKFSPYGVSKAALNWTVRRIHIEEPWLTAYVTHPGLVLTDMAAAMDEGTDMKALGAITVQESVDGVLKTLDKAGREIGGTFQNYDGTVLPW